MDGWDCHFLSSLKIIPSLPIYMVLSLCNRGGELVWLLGNAAVGRGGGPGWGIPRASRLGAGAGPLPGTGASGYPTTRLSPDPLFGALLPPLPANLRPSPRDLHRTLRIQIPTTRHPPVALLRRSIPVPSGPAPRLPTYVSDAVGLLVARPCKQTAPFRPPQSPPVSPSNPRKIVIFTPKLALCTKNDRICPGPLKATYRYI